MKNFYILGIALLIFHSAMAQWFPQNSFTTNNLNSVYFTNANTGYAVGDTGTILKTTDGGSQAQSCLPEGITFTTQAQVDSFQINYQSCSEIEGNVIISGPDISDLNGLNVLTSIEGNLEIYNDSLLTDLTGLDNLSSIGDLSRFTVTLFSPISQALAH